MATSKDQSDQRSDPKNEFSLVKGNTGTTSVVLSGNAKMDTHVGDTVTTHFGERSVFGQVATHDAKVNNNYQGGTHIIAGSMSEDKAKAAISGNTGSTVKVSVKYSDHSGRFQGEFKPDQTLFDVAVAICKEKKDKQFKHIKSKAGDVVDEDTALSILQKEGVLQTITAVFE